MQVAIVALGLALLPGLFSEVIKPKTPGRCVGVKYKDRVYKAEQIERSRLTGSVVLTMQPGLAEFQAALAAKRDPKGREIRLSGYDSLTDDTSCSCSLLMNCTDE